MYGVLDTGVNIGHPLLDPFITQEDQLSLEPDWDGADDDGHGTGMAGLATWGDLTEPLESAATIEVGHRLESVKILRYSGDNEGKPSRYCYCRRHIYAGDSAPSSEKSIFNGTFNYRCP